MSRMVLIFLIILHFITQAYAAAVIQPSIATGPKPVQQVAVETGPKLQSKHNSSQENDGPKPVSKEGVAKPLETQPSATQPDAAPVRPKNLSKIAKAFYKKHTTLLTPGVSKSDFKVQKHLSTGDDGSVYIVQRIKDKAKFALKVMELTAETNLSELAEQVDIQVQATKDKRTHINNVFAVFLDGNKICMLLELMKGDVNHNVLGTYSKNITEKQFCVMTKGMMEDLAYLEERGILHRDLDTCNLFVNEKNEIVIGDFQRATKEREFSCTYHAWDHYAPPEWERTDIKCTIKVDVWAIGVFFRDIKDHMPVVSDAFELMLSDNAVSSMFSTDPARRPSFKKILSSPLFQQC